MSSCPDGIVHQLLHGAGSEQERAHLIAHLKGCDDCRVALSVARDFDAVLGTEPGDDEIAARIAGRVVRSPRRRFRPAAVIVAAILLGSAGAAAGTSSSFRTRVAAFFGQGAPEVRDNSARVVEPVAVSAPEVKAVQAPQVDVAAEPSEAEEVEEEPAEEPPALPQRVPKAAPPKSAADLFSAANAHRRNGNFAEAKKAYEVLQRQYPGRQEALVSHVSLGRMLKGAAPGEALRHFNAYLSQSAHTTLAAEALYGKASALSALGSASAEKAAWTELLRRFPTSVYAEQARSKLGR